MKQFILTLFLTTLSFSSFAQDSNWVPCPTDLYVYNQGDTYTVEAYANTTNATWTVNGVATPNSGSTSYTFTGTTGSLYEVCVSFPCDTSIVELCETIFIDSSDVEPVDSLQAGCLTDLYAYVQGAYLTAFAEFDGEYNGPLVTWSLNGDTLVAEGDYFSTMLEVGTYELCVSYETDSCSTTLCETIVIEETNSTSGCLVDMSAYAQGSYLSAFAEFTGDFNETLIIWTLNGDTVMSVGDYFSTTLELGTYELCVSYEGDSCSTTLCETIVIEEDNNGNDSIIFDDWINENWDSVYVDSTVWDDLNDWYLEEWSDSIVIVIFGDDLNFDDLDSSIYVFLDGLTQDEIDSLFNAGVVVFGRDALINYWDDFLTENEETLSGVSFNDLLDLFNTFVTDAATDALGVDELEKSNIDVFFDPNTNIMTINADNVGQINVYNVQGQRVMSSGYSAELNLSSIQTGMYVLSIEIDGKVYSHKMVK
ncbi:MAG: T9SS type A sorting domain-containing protein [Flavobacteriales bacterium]